MKTVMILALLLVALLSPMAAMAGPIDRNYEAAKGAEISSIKLQLATQPGSSAVQELNEAESALRRLKAAKTPEQRRKVASELEMAITHLRLAAEAGALPR